MDQLERSTKLIQDLRAAVVAIQAMRKQLDGYCTRCKQTSPMDGKRECPKCGARS